MVGADAIVNVRFLGRYICTYMYVRIQKPDNVWTYTVASNPVVTGSDFVRRFNLFLKQCVQSTQSTACIYSSSSPVPRKPGPGVTYDTRESLPVS